MKLRKYLLISSISLGILILLVIVCLGSILFIYEYNSYLYRKTLPTYYGDAKIEDHSFFFDHYLFVRKYSLYFGGFTFNNNSMKVYRVHNLPKPMNNDIIINIYYTKTKMVKSLIFTNDNNSKLIVEFMNYEGNILFKQTILLKDLSLYDLNNTIMLKYSNPDIYHDHNLVESDIENIRKIKIDYYADRTLKNYNTTFNIRVGFGSFLEHY